MACEGREFTCEHAWGSWGSWQPSSFITLHLYCFWDQLSQSNTKFWPLWQVSGQLWVFLCLASKARNLGKLPYFLTFTWGWESKLQLPCLFDKHIKCSTFSPVKTMRNFNIQMEILYDFLSSIQIIHLPRKYL